MSSQHRCFYDIFVSNRQSENEQRAADSFCFLYRRKISPFFDKTCDRTHSIDAADQTGACRQKRKKDKVMIPLQGKRGVTSAAVPVGAIMYR